jgi:hypothetical protein
VSTPDDDPGPAGFDAAYRDDLVGAFAEAWARMARGAADRRSAFHVGQLATVDAEGAPQVRSVVLRGADRARRTLRLHTDRRSPKARELAAEPRTAFLLYDARARLQLRLTGRARLSTDGPGPDAAWAASRPGARVCYRQPVAPGAPIAAPGAVDPGPEARAPADPEAGRATFATVEIEIARLDWLYLAASGHRRALFTWEGEGWRGGWLAP